MIIIHMCDNGLGNQLYIYALGTILSERCGERNVYYDLSRLPDAIVGRKLHRITDILDMRVQLASPRMIRKYAGLGFYFRIPVLTGMLKKNMKYWYKYQNFMNRHIRQTPGVVRIEENAQWWDVTQQEISDNCRLFENLDPNKNYYIEGFWENPVYFEGHRALLLEKMRFRDMDILHSALADEIRRENSVSVHIRRGDYLRTYDEFRYDLCGGRYYETAMSEMKRRAGQARFYIFTDDPDYAQQVYGGRPDVTVVRGNRDYEDLALMTLCRHDILANSTFSFWGAFLNRNPDKIVITPDVHYLKKADGEWKEIPFPYLKEWQVVGNHSVTPPA